MMDVFKTFLAACAGTLGVLITLYGVYWLATTKVYVVSLPKIF